MMDQSLARTGDGAEPVPGRGLRRGEGRHGHRQVARQNGHQAVTAPKHRHITTDREICLSFFYIFYKRTALFGKIIDHIALFALTL